MFRKCSTGHDEVRWSMMAPNSHRCWYCGNIGEEHRALTVTSTMPQFAPDSAYARIAEWAMAREGFA